MKARRAASKADAAARVELDRGQASPFVAISATMGWETFHLVQVLWLGIIDLPLNAPEKDWELQVALSLNTLLLLCLSPSILRCLLGCETLLPVHPPGFALRPKSLFSAAQCLSSPWLDCNCF